MATGLVHYFPGGNTQFSVKITKKTQICFKDFFLWNYSDEVMGSTPGLGEKERLKFFEVLTKPSLVFIFLMGNKNNPDNKVSLLIDPMFLRPFLEFLTLTISELLHLGLLSVHSGCLSPNVVRGSFSINLIFNLEQKFILSKKRFLRFWKSRRDQDYGSFQDENQP